MLAKSITAIMLAALLAAAGCRAAPEAQDGASRPALGLMTTLPLFWGESTNIVEMLASDAEPGWVREVLAARYQLEPLDTLEEATLARLDRLLMAQPRALSPSENVALDAWVRRGGTLLLFADPVLTRHSRYPIGDRRRPQDVVLLSPILRHWGLDLRFDEGQPAGERTISYSDLEIPVDRAGTFERAPQTECVISAQGAIARCRIGKGRVLALADAAVLDDLDDGDQSCRRAVLTGLLAASLS